MYALMVILTLGCAYFDHPCPEPDELFRPSVPPEMVAHTCAGALISCISGETPCAPEYLACGDYACSYCVTEQEIWEWADAHCPDCVVLCGDGGIKVDTSCSILCDVVQ